MENEFKVTVHYVAAEKPFKDRNASRNETVGHLKARVLDKFGLHEGTGSDGSSKTYTLYDEKTALENPAQTLGEIAGRKRHLVLKLVEQIIQGDAKGPQSVSELNLADDLATMANLEDVGRWEIENPDSLEVWVKMSSRDSTERFQARLLWRVYPDEPPSLKFRNPITGRLDDPTAWPVVRGFRPTSLDACVNYCQEGFALHPEWRNDPRYRWCGSGNALLKVVRTLQVEFDESFNGRFKP